MKITAKENGINDILQTFQLDTSRWWWRVTSWVRHEALLQIFSWLTIRTCSKITAVQLQMHWWW